MRTLAPLLRTLPLPKGWPLHVKPAALHAISLASAALTLTRSRTVSVRSSNRRLLTDLDHTPAEIALLREEIDLKDTRWSRLPSRSRPHDSPIERIRMLELKATRGWSREEAAKRFQVNEQTMQTWFRRVDEDGEKVLLQLDAPVNRFPDFVRLMVRRLKVLVPAMGKLRIAQTLARAGLHPGATTVSRFLKDKEPIPDEEIEGETEVDRVVTAKHTGHVWHIDFTAVPTLSGFWAPWSPNALTQRWPFCWWVGVVVDHFSRAVVGFAVFTSKPSFQQTQDFLNHAIEAAGKAPKYLICDKDSAFWCTPFKEWCVNRVIRPRSGKVAQHNSVAIVERFIKSLKYENTRRMLVPLRLHDMRHELSLYMNWFNEFRPHRALGGATPREVYDGSEPANTNPRVEPRKRWLSGPENRTP